MIETARRSSFQLLLFSAVAFSPVSATSQVPSYQRVPEGLIVVGKDRILKVSICTPNLARVTYAAGNTIPKTTSFSVIQQFHPVPFVFRKGPDFLELKTSRMIVRVKDDQVSFFDLSGHSIVAEQPHGKTLTPTILAGLSPEPAFSSRAGFSLQPDEGIYGLGQHQDGLMDYRGSTVTLEQHNMEVAIPFMVSSKGYGLLWDNPAFTTVSVDGPEPTTTIPASAFRTTNGEAGLSGEYFDGSKFERSIGNRVDATIDFIWNDGPINGLKKNEYSVRWTGQLLAPRTGRYTLSTKSDDGARLFVDDKLVIDDWSVHAPKLDSTRIQLKQGPHRIKLEYFQGGGGAEIHLSWAPPSAPKPPITEWKSEAARDIDYYFIYGPSIETVISSYRDLTGQAPLPGKWALGFWQSKERYSTQQEWLDIAKEYRDRREPIDNIVQDWYYWNPGPWGSHWFDPTRYPDPAAGVSALHDQFHDHIMISVWGKFDTPKADDPLGANYRALNDRGMLYPGLNYYDAFDPEARRVYWSLMNRDIFSKGFDAWWLDASEPEVDMQQFRRTRTAQGLGARVLNAWPLEHTKGVYQNQRQVTEKKRVFILTRSAYAGQQRNGAATWSGDITASWDVYAHQIPAGLNFCLSGFPYWTTDIGAFFVPSYSFPGGSANPEYRELFTRWFEYGAFCPIFRVHGTDTPKELWRFGPNEPILAKYDRLRYRLLPYIYSQSWQITHSGSTLMRALVMDFRTDNVARNLTDEFMFGPSILVAPVITPGATKRAVYLPSGTSWYDFWTGAKYSGGQWISASAPIEKIPLFVKAGSIIPMGPDLQWSNEKPEDPITCRIYPGSDAHFTYYEDEGDSYNYEKGKYAITTLIWSDKKQTLVVSPTVGTYPGMSRTHHFNAEIVKSGIGG
jgi:alpha-D-xyloside xylohydrolase